ncbi:Carbon catabolite repressor protein 4-like protein [Thalictrum thalictroides]|uniref:Carbon catabolite repressor protein 4-like protein n=1 Tax=Thalictrum thalictroides TaxID=46969 RepID=A0A7J6UUD2_THATH|nr:Carbon catabolite repressor protein 4-like protein [Thalictrum thalictroides]
MEVDRFSDLADLLKEDGFKGTYKARTGEACDGCAIFWKEDMFTLMHQESIEFRDFNLRDNVAQFCVLKMRPNHSEKDTNNKISKTQTLLIGNIHALFNPNRGDIKMGQIRLFVKKAHTISGEWGNIPVTIAGDLNSAPQSAIYKFLASSELDLLQYDRRQLSGQIEGYRSRWEFIRAHTKAASSWSEEELQLAAGSEGITHLQHYLQLCSAYVGVPGSSCTRDGYGEPLATSYHSKFMGTVDYIWHSKGLIPVGVVETLPIDILRKNGGLPSEEWGSDHLALVCKLAFADDSSRI